MFSAASNDQEPLFHLGEKPIHTPLAVVLVFVGSMLATTVLMAFEVTEVFSWLAFSSGQVLGGQVWRILSYGLVNPPSVWFAVDMVMLWWFGRELERFFGRRTFMLLFAGLYLITPLLFTVLGLWWPLSLLGERGAFAMFIAFATLYPGAVFLFNVLAKWLALALVGIYTLMAISARDLPGLLSLWATCGFAFAFVRHQQGAFSLPRLRLRRGAGGARRSTAAAPTTATTDLDAVLDKIARSGIASLTEAERAVLETGRETLLRRKGSGRS